MPSAVKEEKEANRRTSETHIDMTGIEDARFCDARGEDRSPLKEMEEKMDQVMQRMEYTITSMNSQTNSVYSMIKELKNDSDTKFDRITEVLAQMISENQKTKEWTKDFRLWKQEKEEYRNAEH